MTNREQLECLCDHLTAFAGGLLIMPNKVNFKEDIAMFLRFWENPVGIIAVSVVLSIYIIAIIFARRKDREDEVKVSTKLFQHVYTLKYVLSFKTCVYLYTPHTPPPTMCVVFQGAIVDLPDNDPSFKHCYQISLKTGARRKSGTTANVVMTLKG